MLNNINNLDSIKLLFLSLVLNEFPNIYKARKLFSELKNSERSPDMLKLIRDKISFNSWKQAQRELLMARENGIEVVSIIEDSYPEKLRNIQDPPLIIYVKGSLQIKKSLAIVGSRNCTNYGLEIAKNTAFELSQRKVSIISGLAFGVDCAAHLGALKNAQENYPGIAVLGSGLLEISPKSNITIAYDLLKYGGAIISEYPLRETARSHFFPERNRIVSGLSDAVLVVEAAEKSGSLITARLALEQGREVFAVPGQLNSIYSKGTNLLLKDGARVFVGVEDILEFLKISTSSKRISDSSLKIEKILNKSEKQIYDIIAKKTEVSKEDLLEQSNLRISELEQILCTLEAKSLIKQSFSGTIELS